MYGRYNKFSYFSGTLGISLLKLKQKLPQFKFQGVTSGEFRPRFILTQEIEQVVHSEIEALQHQLEHLAVIIDMVSV